MNSIIRPGLVAIAFGLLVLSVISQPASALEVPPRPTDTPIVDQTNTLSAEQKATLANQIAEERQKSSNQIAIVMVPSLKDESLEGYSLKLAREWGIGSEKSNNGVLLFIARDDKQLRIEVGRGLEGALTDVQAGRIIRGDIAPHFKQGRYFEGIQAGLTGIIAAIHNEYAAASTVSEQPDNFPWETIFFLGLFGFSWLSSVLARTKSWWAGGVVGGAAGGVAGILTGSLFIGLIGIGLLSIAGLALDKIVSANYRSRVERGDTPSWWAGGSILGGGSGGGFGGFGGGSFGGGGSSGSW